MLDFLLETVLDLLLELISNVLEPFFSRIGRKLFRRKKYAVYQTTKTHSSTKKRIR